MKHYDHPNYKRTKVWSSSFSVWHLNMGKLDTAKLKNGTKTVRKYFTKSGHRGYTGTSVLKTTQCFAWFHLVRVKLNDFPMYTSMIYQERPRKLKTQKLFVWRALFLFSFGGLKGRKGRAFQVFKVFNQLLVLSL